MSQQGSVKVLFTWVPPRGLERLEGCLSDAEVFVTDKRGEMLDFMVNAEVACVGAFDAEMLRVARNLRWIHAMSGGVGPFLFPEMVASPVPLTCIKECFDVPGSEYAFAVMLAFARRLDYDIRQRPFRTFEWREPIELRDKTVGIIGLGNIGKAVARKARCFDMRVIGLARRPQPRPPDVDELVSSAQLPYLLSQSDFAVVAVPFTSQTLGLFGEVQLRMMKRTAYLVDVSGRPAIYDEVALQHALEEGWIAGASLQLAGTPADDWPLWEQENLLISFHRSCSQEQYDRGFDMFCENLHRYRRGQTLLGLVDKRLGY